FREAKKLSMGRCPSTGRRRSCCSRCRAAKGVEVRVLLRRPIPPLSRGAASSLLRFFRTRRDSVALARLLEGVPRQGFPAEKGRSVLLPPTQTWAKDSGEASIARRIVLASRAGPTHPLISAVLAVRPSRVP